MSYAAIRKILFYIAKRKEKPDLHIFIYKKNFLSIVEFNFLNLELTSFQTMNIRKS